MYYTVLLAFKYSVLNDSIFSQCTHSFNVATANRCRSTIQSHLYFKFCTIIINAGTSIRLNDLLSKKNLIILIFNLQWRIQDFPNEYANSTGGANLLFGKIFQWRIQGRTRDLTPSRSKFFQFHAVFGNFFAK